MTPCFIRILLASKKKPTIVTKKLMTYYPYMVSKNSHVIRGKLGSKLKKAREKSNPTQADVASKSDIHVNYYARIERGEENPSFEILHRIVRVLKVKTSEILPF